MIAVSTSTMRPEPGPELSCPSLPANLGAGRSPYKRPAITTIRVPTRPPRAAAVRTPSSVRPELVAGGRVGNQARPLRRSAAWREGDGPPDVLAVRFNLGLTQREFAALLGVHPITVSKWEREQLAPDAWRAELLAILRFGLISESLIRVLKRLLAEGYPALALCWCASNRATARVGELAGKVWAPEQRLSPATPDPNDRPWTDQ